jgi:hypothetical protein
LDAEDRRKKSEDRIWKTEYGRQNIEDRMQKKLVTHESGYQTPASTF